MTLVRSVLGVDEGTLRQELEAQLEQAMVAAGESKEVAHNEAKRAKATQQALRQVWLNPFVFKDGKGWRQLLCCDRSSDRQIWRGFWGDDCGWLLFGELSHRRPL